MNSRIFVYGTLQRGQRNHDLLLGQEFLGTAQTQPRYRLYDCGRHPGLVDDPHQGVAIQGEVWRVSDEALQKLDEYEGVPDYFSRRPILLHGRDSPVEAYYFNSAVSGLKECGDRWPPEELATDETQI